MPRECCVARPQEGTRSRRGPWTRQLLEHRLGHRTRFSSTNLPTHTSQATSQLSMSCPYNKGWQAPEQGRGRNQSCELNLLFAKSSCSSPLIRLQRDFTIALSFDTLFTFLFMVPEIPFAHQCFLFNSFDQTANLAISLSLNPLFASSLDPCCKSIYLRFSAMHPHILSSFSHSSHPELVITLKSIHSQEYRPSSSKHPFPQIEKSKGNHGTWQWPRKQRRCCRRWYGQDQPLHCHHR